MSAHSCLVTFYYLAQKEICTPGLKILFGKIVHHFCDGMPVAKRKSPISCISDTQLTIIIVWIIDDDIRQRGVVGCVIGVLFFFLLAAVVSVAVIVVVVVVLILFDIDTTLSRRRERRRRSTCGARGAHRRGRRLRLGKVMHVTECTSASCTAYTIRSHTELLMRHVI